MRPNPAYVRPAEDEETAGNNGETPKVFVELATPSDILAYTPPAENVLVGDCHIVRGSVFAIAGPPGVGKSRGATALAEAGATKYSWFGMPVLRTFKTLIVQAENSLLRLRQELTEIDEPRLADSLRITPPPPFGLCFWRHEFRDQLKRQADEFGPDAVILDPWNQIARDDRAKDYLESFELCRAVFPSGDQGVALGIIAHTRKPLPGERANGRALLHLVTGSYVLGSVPRCIFVMQHATDDTTEDRVVFTCCKNNDGELGPRSAWVRQNGLFEPVQNFDWNGWEKGEKAGLFTLYDVPTLFVQSEEAVARTILAQRITEKGVSKRTAYRRIEEAQKSGLIKFHKGKDGYVLSQ